MATFTLPTTLKLAHLKLLSQKCGLLTTGTKPILIKRLHDAITSSHPQPKPSNAAKKTTRILSIDMGIRNLAYCILDVPNVSQANPKSRSKKNKKVEKETLPILQSWHRLAVSRAPVPSKDAEEEDPAAPLVKEAFDPATLSSIAYTLLRNRLLAMNPDVILIERQRFRSMGSKHILEWTIRVNMFESILYAVLHTLKAEGLWDGTVVPVIPGKVGPFWVGDEGVVEAKKKVRNTQSAKAKNKGVKIDLVRGWCESGVIVRFGNGEVEEMVRAYMEKWDRRPGGGKKKGKVVLEEGQEKMGKLDDLADCLLQGMAWVQWEENKRIALKYGVEVLLEP